MSSLYERLGGEKAVNAAVEHFYRRVLADGRIARFFQDVDMDEQIAKQKSFLTMAKSLESNGRLEPALKRYRLIIREFPTTAAAEEARERERLLAAKAPP